MYEKQSFWQKVKDLFNFGGSYVEYDEEYDDQLELEEDSDDLSIQNLGTVKIKNLPIIEEIIEEPVQVLPIDLIETHDAIFVTAFTSGARKNDVQISLTRSALTININRQEPTTNSYRETRHVSELVWGDFERVIELPDEVDIDNTDAKEEFGLLTIKMPKIDKERQNRVRVQ